jgi:hypothetical protein
LDLGAKTVCTCEGDVDGLIAMLAGFGMAPNPDDVPPMVCGGTTLYDLCAAEVVNGDFAD